MSVHLQVLIAAQPVQIFELVTNGNPVGAATEKRRPNSRMTKGTLHEIASRVVV